ncbi:Longitudinals lacking protein-like [Frankliniella fusca]|uniref:Longitudinals lacking protein-like n=1 Tax=Frankliniella fusca TaxID=407009 RepID=A0AAE1LPA9_9NEOP|nr:Longitudinals lacking protein-like [Frankliniella fusca]
MSDHKTMSSKSDEKVSLSLRWGSHKETMLQSLESSYGDQDFVDMTVACEGQSIQAHKVVVSACSTHLKHLLKENPCPHPIIILKDVAMKELRCLMEFMYCGRVTVEQEQIEPLLEAAKMLGVRGLATGETVEDLEEPESEKSVSTVKSESDHQLRTSQKRQRSESPTSNKKARPIPPLQSILAQTLLTSSTASRQNLNDDVSNENLGEMSSHSLSPSNTLAKLLAQSPVSTLGSSHSCSLEAEINNAESNNSKADDNSSVEGGFQLKQEAVDLDLAIDNPTEALELEYQNPDTDETVDTDTYLQQGGLSSPYDPTLHDRIGKATAFMLSLAKRANQNNSFGSSQRKLSFHEPRPCPVCSKLCRDSTTLRTHMAMMHPSSPLSAPNLPRVVSAGEASRSTPLSAAEYLASMAENLKSESQWRRWQ